MSQPDLLLAIDQGTTSTRAVVFDRSLRPVESAGRPLAVRHPRPGWVEQDPMEILDSIVGAVADVLDRCGGPGRVAAAGLDNQGETVVAWDAETGRPLAPAVVWQCKRSGPIVERLRAAGREPAIRERTGLPLDPYFSAGKMTWLLEESPEVAAAARAGNLRLGTVDAWLTSQLGGEAVTDPSTASRTQLYSLAALDWDEQLLDWFAIPPESLPRIVPSAGDMIPLRHDRWAGELPLRAMLCDQQAALAGQACFEPGTLKATYGTGVFVNANAGPEPLVAEGLETSVAWSLADGPLAYCLQGGVFTAGALVDWLSGLLRIASGASELDELAGAVPNTAGVRLLPALSGLGAPWWRPGARAVIAGLTASADRRHIARAALDGIAHRVCDVVERVTAAIPDEPSSLRIDGGLTSSRYLLQRQADLLGLRLELPGTTEATALGIAGFAGLGAALLTFHDIGLAASPARVIEPALDPSTRAAERAGWRSFVEAASAVAAVDAGEGRREIFA